MITGHDIYTRGLVPVTRVRRTCGPNIYQRAGPRGHFGPRRGCGAQARGWAHLDDSKSSDSLHSRWSSERIHLRCALPQLYSSTGGTTCLRACKIKHTARLAEAAIPNQSTKRHESRGHIKHWLARSVFSFFFLGAHSLARCLMQCFSFFFRILMAYIHTLTRAFIEKNDRKWILKKPLSSS